MTDPTTGVQLSRQKGDRWPEGTVMVSRPSKFGNPFRIGWWFREGTLTAHEQEKPDSVLITPEVAKSAFEQWVRESKSPDARWIREHVHELAGKRPGCWCALGAPCHRDVLARFADESVASKTWWVLAPNERTVANWRREKGLDPRRVVRLACGQDIYLAQGRRWGPLDEVVVLHGGPRCDWAAIDDWLVQIGRPRVAA